MHSPEAFSYGHSIKTSATVLDYSSVFKVNTSFSEFYIGEVMGEFDMIG